MLHFKLELADVKLTRQIIERNGIRYPLTTFRHKDLQAIQLFFLESEALQSVGRSRVLRYPVTVKLYSQCVLPSACVTEDEKKLGRERLIERLLAAK